MNPERFSTLTERLAWLEADAAACKENRTDVEQRLRRVERAVYLASGALAVLQLALKFL